MKTSSWEIILAGFIFVFVAIYLIESKSEVPPSNDRMAMVDSLHNEMKGNKLHIIKLKDLEKFENLKELEKLENLKNLKNLSSFLPAEFQSEFEAELEGVIKEFEDQNVTIHIDSTKGTVSIEKVLGGNTDGWSVISPGIFAYVKEFDAQDIKNTELSLPFGSIDVVGTSNAMAKISIQASGQVTSKADIQSKLHINSLIGDQKARFLITPNTTSNTDQNIQLQATLSIPHESMVHFSTKGGHITSENIKGDQLYETEGGHIKLQSVTGDVKAHTGGGHIAISNANATMDLFSNGGNIRAEKSNGTLIMNTKGGNLYAIDFSGEVNATTKGGNIEVRFLELIGKCELETGAGSITVWVPESINAAIDLSANSIDIAQALQFVGTRQGGRAQGIIGLDQARLQAKTNYGNITLKTIK